MNWCSNFRHLCLWKQIFPDCFECFESPTAAWCIKYTAESEEVLPAEYETDYKVKKTYYLSKEQKPTGKTIKISHGRTKTKKLGKIKNHTKRPAVKCMDWSKFN